MRIERLKPYGIDLLFEAILSLETMEECYAFLDDLCTINELKALGQRLQVAKLLREGETYATIEAKTGASTATISRVKRSLNYGNDGYDLVFERLKRKQMSQEKETETVPDKA
ncbi:MAG: YerC/YecD family TrpR-related protein [Candidatus Carbobacillus sp.]|nr:YerC/YecD family TrpR-related protein [Candidatus Carbobacillus sp.]